MCVGVRPYCCVLFLVYSPSKNRNTLIHARFAYSHNCKQLKVSATATTSVMMAVAHVHIVNIPSKENHLNWIDLLSLNHLYRVVYYKLHVHTAQSVYGNSRALFMYVISIFYYALCSPLLPLSSFFRFHSDMFPSKIHHIHRIYLRLIPHSTSIRESFIYLLLLVLSPRSAMIYFHMA